MTETRQYTVKEFSAQPSKVIHRVMNHEEDVVITLRGIPAIRLVPVQPPATSPSIFDVWGALPEVLVAREPMALPHETYSLTGEGPLGSAMVLEDRR